MVGITHLGMDGPPGTPRCLVLSTALPSDTSLAHRVPSGLEKISKKFPCVWTPFNIDFCDVKNMQKIVTGTGHYVNRLVPKNDIK